MGELHHGLAGAYHLARLGQGFNHGAIGIGAQDRVCCFIARDLFLRFGGCQLRGAAIAKGLGLLVFLLG